LFERPPNGECAIIVHIDLPKISSKEDLIEFRELVISANIEPLAEVTGSRLVPEAKYFVGAGKAEEIRNNVQLYKPDVVIFNHTLTPAQERNLEKLFTCRVIDRTTLILDVFAKRARSHEGKLQVELAQLNHLASRLVRGWTHLERQKGGIGLRGPGETQLETDRRLLKQRVVTLQQRLKKTHAQRELQRHARTKADLPTISLVGYTNAGKSSLFNRLTQAQVYVADQLFATLDPTYRRISIPQFGSAILIDTVGFIRHLPHGLIEAFKATLEETTFANLLLHVIDVHHEERMHHIEQVQQVLKEIKALDIPILEVYNKIDLCSEIKPKIDYDPNGIPQSVYISVLTGQGIDLLFQAISQCLNPNQYEGEVCLFSNQGRLRAALYSHQAIMTELIDEFGHYHLKLKLPYSLWHKLINR
jgi:GTP-binding protein HflX